MGRLFSTHQGKSSNQYWKVLCFRQPSYANYHRRLPMAEPRVVQGFRSLSKKDSCLHWIIDYLYLLSGKSSNSNKIICYTPGYSYYYVRPRVKMPNKQRDKSAPQTRRVGHSHTQGTALGNHNPGLHSCEASSLKNNNIGMAHGTEYCIWPFSFQIPHKSWQATKNPLCLQINHPCRRRDIF